MLNFDKFCAIGVFNEADILESSSILIYSELQAGLCTQLCGMDATLIKELLDGD
jgi:hypothetical protein